MMRRITKWRKIRGRWRWIRTERSWGNKVIAFTRTSFLYGVTKTDFFVMTCVSSPPVKYEGRLSTFQYSVPIRRDFLFVSDSQMIGWQWRWKWRAERTTNLMWDPNQGGGLV
jgi:hypothetical protein